MRGKRHYTLYSGSTKCDESSAPSGGGGGTPGVTPGGRFGESNTKLDECYEDWKSSVVAAKLKEASEAVDYFKKHKSGKGESKGAGKGGKPARQPKGPRIG